MNLFAVLGLPVDFDIDRDLLENRYRLLVSRFHPDKTASLSAFERRQAMMMSATVNEAYRVLSSPPDRAAYILRGHGIDADAPENTRFPPEFLTRQMIWRETLDESEGAALDRLRAEVEEAADEITAKLRSDLKGESWEDAGDDVRRLRFTLKLLEQIKDKRG